MCIYIYSVCLTFEYLDIWLRFMNTVISIVRLFEIEEKKETLFSSLSYSIGLCDIMSLHFSLLLSPRRNMYLYVHPIQNW